MARREDHATPAESILVPRLPLVALLFTLALPASAAQAAADDIIVVREPGLSAAERTDLRADADVDHVRMLKVPDAEIVRAAPGEVTDAVAALNADPDVVAAEPDAPVRALTNDTLWSSLWGLENAGQSIYGVPGTSDADIDATAAWTSTLGSGVTVAVVDTGVETGHADLSGQAVTGYDFVAGDTTPEDVNGHGTHVAGTIAAKKDNSTGVVGVAPAANVMGLKALDDDGSGWTSDIADAFAHAAANGAKVVNASLGGTGGEATYTAAINAAPNTLFVVAAGNENSSNDSVAKFPCNVARPNVLCVGASTNTDARASFSNWSATHVDLFAPGDDIRSTYPGGTYAWLSGTSMASPHAAGAAALVFAAHPTWTPSQVRSALMSSVDPVPAFASISVSGGRLNAARALDVTPPPADGGGSTPAPPPETDPDPTPVAPPASPPAESGDEEPQPEEEEGGEEEDEPVAPPALAVRRKGSTSLCRTGCAAKAFEVRFTLPRPAPIRTVYERRVCKGRGCTWVSVAKRTVAGRTGANTVKVATKVGTKRLGRGQYRVTFSVDTDEGRQTGRVTFTVR